MHTYTSYVHLYIHMHIYIYIQAYAHINQCMQAYAGCICQHWSRRRGWGETGWAGGGAMHLGGLWEAQKHDLVIVLASFSRARARAGETLRCIPPPHATSKGLQGSPVRTTTTTTTTCLLNIGVCIPICVC